ncbi:MAG: M18 family aminopeptidase [Methylococcales bacterium]|nr:M18 family aminopeptidase [Methylococcales bacterium]
MKEKQLVQDLLDFIDNSPSPYHAVKSLENQLASYDFEQLNEKHKWELKPEGRYYVIRDDSSIIFFTTGKKSLTDSGYKIFGAHTDSPGLKIKPNPVNNVEGLIRLGVEVYGGPILATFTDRDLSLAGRISYKTPSGKIASKLVHFDQPLLRLPNLAIHMNRTVNEEGLKLHKQNELALIISTSFETLLSQQYLIQLLEKASGIKEDQILSWELNVYDTQKGSFWGDKQQFYANSQLDNLASCHIGLQAILDESALKSENTLLCAFFDHEEIGSESTKGADGSFLPDILERIALAMDLNKEDYQRILANSFMISADMAHAYQPNFPAAYEPDHKVTVNKGPVIKVNANHRYSSECISEAMFILWCEQTNTPYQKYSHRTDIPCGSTIGPMTSAKLGIRTVDVGNPMWAMHSIRESAGVKDHTYMINVIKYFFSTE